jgi:hypothetical protein
MHSAAGRALGRPLHHLLDLLLLQAAVSAPMLNSLPALVATITDVTPAISAVVGNDGHPELREFVKQRTAGPAQLQLALVPNAQGDGQHSINFAISSGAAVLLANLHLSAVPALSRSHACEKCIGLYAAGDHAGLPSTATCYYCGSTGLA